jgi:hypothetical protein
MNILQEAGGTSKRIRNLNSTLEKANHLPVILKINIETRFNFFFTIISAPAYGTIYRITGSFLNAATSILKRVSVRIFKIHKCFHRSKQKLEFPFSPEQGTKKI